MRRHATLAAVALTLVFAGSAAAHDEGGAGGGPYTGGGCGGHYISPYNDHASWWDCQSTTVPDRVVVVWTWDRRAYFNVYRTYAHIRDGQFSYRSERFIYSFS